MSKVVKMRALIERAKRFYIKKDGTILHKHKEGNRDYLMNGDLFVYTVVPENNSIDWYGNLDSFLELCRSEGILKDNEDVEEQES